MDAHIYSMDIFIMSTDINISSTLFYLVKSLNNSSPCDCNEVYNNTNTSIGSPVAKIRLWLLFFFLFFRGRKGKKGKACIGSQ